MPVDPVMYPGCLTEAQRLAQPEHHCEMGQQGTHVQKTRKALAIVAISIGIIAKDIGT